MQDVNKLSCEQLVEMAFRYQLISGYERHGEFYLLRLEADEAEFEADVVARFLRGMIRTYLHWSASCSQRAVAAGITA